MILEVGPFSISCFPNRVRYQTEAPFNQGPAAKGLWHLLISVNILVQQDMSTVDHSSPE